MNWIIETFRKIGIKVDSNPTCSKCGKGFKEHTDENLIECSINE